MLSRRTFLKTAVSAAALAGPSRATTNRPPNIVLILTDDLGFGDVGFNGSKIQTPNLNRLAKQGMTIDQFYSASPVCSPSRASLLTGRYPTRVGIPTVLMATDTYGLPDSEITLPQVLKQAGYATAAIGKWHLGSLPQFLPTNRGFDRFFGVPYSNDMHPLPLLNNLDVVEPDTDNNYLTQKYTAAAIQFIRDTTYQPFFLYLAHNVPHVPLGASPAFQGKSPLGPYADAVEELDWSVGQIVQELVNNGLDQNTLCVFTSDNGPWFQGSPGRLRGRKGETYEGGMREPFLAYMPGTIPSGLQVSGAGSMLDLFPTFAGIAGAPLPSVQLDGMNIWQLLTGAQTSMARDLLLFFDNWNLQCARSGQWKLHLSRYNAFPWVAPPAGGRMNLPLVHPELYDVELDPQESYECSARHPAVVKDILAKVRAALPSFPVQVQRAWADTYQLKGAQTSEGALPNPGQ